MSELIPLSERIKRDFYTKDVLALPEETRHARLYSISDDYLKEMIAEIKELEELCNQEEN
jgi:hypothetical protein